VRYNVISGPMRLPCLVKIVADLGRRQLHETLPAHVRDQADASLGHGEPGAIRDDAVSCVPREADTSAHDDAVLDGQERFGIAPDKGVETVLLAPEAACKARAIASAVVEGAHVAASAQGPLASSIEHDELDGGV